MPDTKFSIFDGTIGEWQMKKGKWEYRMQSFIKLLLVCLAFTTGLNPLHTQKIVSLETLWDGSFKEWNIYTEGDSLEGSLKLTWQLSKNWSRWNAELGDFYAAIKLKYENDPNLWEFKSGNELITARTVWSNDFTEWRFTDGVHIIKLESKWKDLPAIWYSKGEEYGYIDIFREIENDPRLWVIEDELDEDISPLYRMAMIFIAVFHSVPRY